MKLLLVLGVLIAVASGYDVECNNQGVIYSDTRVCECFQCFSGVNCEQVDPHCIVDTTGGDPGLYQEYWYQNDLENIENAVPYYRSPYQEYTPYPPNVDDPSVYVFLYFSFCIFFFAD